MRRRDFLLGAVGGVAGFSAASRLFAQSRARLLNGAIGVQLYTLRGMAKKDLARTLELVARAGYSEVEFAGYHGHPVPHVKKMLEQNGLKSPSSHVSMDDLGPLWEVHIEDALTLGQRYLVCAWIDAPLRTQDGYRKVAEKFNEAALKARGDNIQFAYHNYSYEFTPLAGGRSGFEILAAECPPENLAFEADVHWMRAAGQDPLHWFAKYPGRFPMLHVKDSGRGAKRPMTDVGAGTTNWRGILTAAKRAGARHFFVEHDEAADPLRSITRSYMYLRSLRS